MGFELFLLFNFWLFILLVKRMTQFSQLFIMRFFIQIFFPYLDNLLVVIVMKPAPGDHESDDEISFLRLTNLIKILFLYQKALIPVFRLKDNITLFIAYLLFNEVVSSWWWIIVLSKHIFREHINFFLRFLSLCFNLIKNKEVMFLNQNKMILFP